MEAFRPEQLDSPPVDPDSVTPARVRSLEQLMRELTEATGETKTEAGRRLVRFLKLVRPGPAAAALGPMLLTLVESEALVGLNDERGGSLRRQALEALLRLGFPWAMQLEPRVLDELAKSAPPRTNARPALVILGVLCLVALGAGITATLLVRLQPAAVASPSVDFDAVERELDTFQPGPYDAAEEARLEQAIHALGTCDVAAPDDARCWSLIARAYTLEGDGAAARHAATRAKSAAKRNARR